MMMLLTMMILMTPIAQAMDHFGVLDISQSPITKSTRLPLISIVS
jgi:hypothetical protein